MTLEQNISLNLMGEQANTLFFEPVYMDQDLRSQFRMIPNVTTKRKIAFVEEMEKIVRSYSGCGFSPSGTTGMYERWIEVDRARADVEMCWDEFKDTVHEELLSQGTSISDLTPTLLFDILQRQVMMGVKKDIIRLTFFGDKESASAAYDAIDGLWTAYIPEFVAGNNTPYTNLSSGTAFGAGDAIDALKAVYAAQDVRLRGLPDRSKKLYVDLSVWDQYRDDLENSGGGDAGRSQLIDGVETLFFRGIELIPMYDWNRIMEEDFATTDSHQILLTSPNNLAVAGDVLDPENQFKIWFNEEDEKVKMKTRFKLGFNVIHPALMSVGY